LIFYYLLGLIIHNYIILVANILPGRINSYALFLIIGT
jgi:hypothetical protein